MRKDEIVNKMIDIIAENQVDCAEQLDKILIPLYNQNEKLYWDVLVDLVWISDIHKKLIKGGALHPELN